MHANIIRSILATVMALAVAWVSIESWKAYTLADRAIARLHAAQQRRDDQALKVLKDLQLP